MARQRARHVQQAFEFRTHGGRRAGAGRKQVKPRKSEPHRKRPELVASNPVHVVLRVESEVAPLRKRDCYLAIRAATAVALKNPCCRIVHLSIQRTHIHLLVEADDEQELARGMKGFQISAARHLNAALTRRTGTRRRGRVFVDRYHADVITNPRQARHCLAYVLNNWRKHRENERYVARTWKLDPFSTAMAFRGWAEQPDHWDAPEAYSRLLVTLPETWLLYGAWQRDAPISIYEVPKPSETSRSRAIRREVPSRIVGSGSSGSLEISDSSKECASAVADVRGQARVASITRRPRALRPAS